MPFNFPSNPSVGATSTQNGRDYVYAGSNVWQLVAASGGSSGGSLSGSVTIPASGDQYTSYVSLLLSMDGTGASFADSSTASPKTVTATGSVVQSSTQSKWGGKSAYFSTTSDSLSLASSSAWNLGNGVAFVLEAWVRPDATQSGGSAGQGNAGALFSTRNGAVFCPYELSIRNDLKLAILVKGANYTWQQNIPASATALQANAWSHIALVHDGTATTLYVNGVADATINALSFSYANESAPLWIGLGGDGTFRGYIDDVRITVGSARAYAGASIPVPAAAFQIGPYTAAQTLPVVFS